MAHMAGVIATESSDVRVWFEITGTASFIYLLLCSCTLLESSLLHCFVGRKNSLQLTKVNVSLTLAFKIKKLDTYLVTCFLILPAFREKIFIGYFVYSKTQNRQMLINMKCKIIFFPQKNISVLHVVWQLWIYSSPSFITSEPAGSK